MENVETVTHETPHAPVIKKRKHLHRVFFLGLFWDDFRVFFTVQDIDEKGR